MIANERLDSKKPEEDKGHDPERGARLHLLPALLVAGKGIEFCTPGHRGGRGYLATA